MLARFTALASGSGGNACLVQADGTGVLIDLGIGPRLLAQRLAARGLTWRDVRAVLLTHTHGDHWTETGLTHLARLGVPLCCHAAHAEALAGHSDAFNALHLAGLVRMYEGGRAIALGDGLHGLPLPVSHDSGATFGFRLEGGSGLFGPAWSLGYAADLGCWDDGLAAALADVDLLAVEFNHDEDMQRTSGRPYVLIRRVMGDLGHLSNRQAGDLLRAVLRNTRHDVLRHVVTLHLSRECNRPELARTAARDALASAGVAPEVHVAAQHESGPTLLLGPGAPRRTRSA